MTADEFKGIREAIGTQEDIAKLLGVTRVTVARWETGTRRIPEMAARLLVRLRKERSKRKGER
jgi:DNA-binding transcriptional regulator YiaG